MEQSPLEQIYSEHGLNLMIQNNKEKITKLECQRDDISQSWTPEKVLHWYKNIDEEIAGIQGDIRDIESALVRKRELTIKQTQDSSILEALLVEMRSRSLEREYAGYPEMIRALAENGELLTPGSGDAYPIHQKLVSNPFIQYEGNVPETVDIVRYTFDREGYQSSDAYQEFIGARVRQLEEQIGELSYQLEEAERRKQIFMTLLE